MKSLIKGALFVGALALTPFVLPTAEANACASMQSNGGGMSVYNGCGYRIMGNFRGSDGSGGGFGPLSPGSRESTSMRAGSRWGISHCNYEDWTRDTCRPRPSGQISY